MNAAHRECLVQGLPFVSMAMTSLTETFGEYLIYSSHQLELSLRRQISKPFFCRCNGIFLLKIYRSIFCSLNCKTTDVFLLLELSFIKLHIAHCVGNKKSLSLRLTNLIVTTHDGLLTMVLWSARSPSTLMIQVRFGLLYKQRVVFWVTKVDCKKHNSGLKVVLESVS